jgi:hypothetical protein
MRELLVWDFVFCREMGGACQGGHDDFQARTTNLHDSSA